MGKALFLETPRAEVETEDNRILLCAKFVIVENQFD